MCGPTSAADVAEVFPRYFFVVARDHPEVLARVQERLRGDPRIEIFADRRYGERRKANVPPTVDRRHADRRRATKFWDDLTVHPTVVVQRRLEPYPELLRRAETLAAANEALCGENKSLRLQIASVQSRLDALTSDNEALRAAVGRLCTDLALLQGSFSALAQRLKTDPERGRSPHPG